MLYRQILKGASRFCTECQSKGTVFANGLERRYRPTMNQVAEGKHNGIIYPLNCCQPWLSATTLYLQ